MNGAYLLWDGLLQALSTQQQFLPTLLKGMHARMNQLSTRHQFSHDPEKESLHHWLLHIATSDAWSQIRRASKSDVDSDLMTLCCLHPSYWSQALGEELLEAGDEAFTESWSDLLSASAMAGGSEGMGAETNTASPEVDMAEDAEVEGSEEVDDGRSDAGEDLAAWREALMPPSVPIGVVG